MPESLQTKLNNPPIAKAGQDQVIKEGERVVLDGSASTDPDKTPLSFSWEQISPRQPTVKLDNSETSNKVSFVLPDVDRDTIFRFKLVVKDGNGGQAADSINILAKNVEASASPESPSPRQEEQQNQEPASQEIAPNSDSGSGATSDQDPTRTENHSPTAEAQQTLSTQEGKSLSISLKGNDPDKDDKISFVILTNPLHGTIAGFDKTSGLMTYVPSSAFTGQDRLAYNVVDSRGAKSNDGIVVIRINAVDSQTPSSQSSRPGLSPDTSSSNASSSLLSPSPSIANQNTTSPLTPITNTSAVMAGDNKSGTSAPLAQITNDSAVTTGDNSSNGVTSAQNNTKAKTFSSFAASSVQAGEEYQFIKKWGSLGSGNGQFNNPHGIAVMRSSGEAYILDTGNNRVQKFDSNGNFILKWGSLGSGNVQFNNAHGIAVDQSSGEVYVTDTGNNRVQKFSSTGELSLSFNGKAPGSSQFNLPEGVAVSSGFVYVSDVNNHRIVKLNTNGQFVAKWGATGDGQGQFKGPHGVAVDSGSNVYVSDFLNNKVQKFTSTGGFLTAWGSSGSGDGQFNAPHGIAVDSDDSVYVSDRGNNRVQKFNNAGGFLTKFGSACTIQPCPKDGQFNGPDGIGVSSSGSVYVTDIGNNRVQVFAIAAAGPTVLSTQPQNGAVDVPLDSVINANFSKAMDITTINTDNFKLFTEDGVTPVAGTVSLSSDNKNATFTPTSSLSTSPTYKGTIKGGAAGVKDIVGNPLAADYLWSFSMRASITISSLNTTTPKWGSAINVTGTVSNFVSTDKIIVDWDDGTPSTQISPILPGGHFSAIHTYSVSAIGVHNVVAKLQTIGGVVKATSDVKVITVQKHTSALTLDMKPTESPQCANCPFYVIGKLTDSDSIPPNKEVGGKTIALSGSGASSLANPVHTGGVIFSGTPSENLTLTSSVLQMPSGSVISLPAGTHGVAFKFNGAVGVTLTKGNDQTIQLNVASAEFDAPEGLKKITIGSGSGELENLNTRDFAVDGTDDHQIAVDFSQNIAAPGSYSTLVCKPRFIFLIRSNANTRWERIENSCVIRWR